jgi:hypothetical protein
MEAIPQWRLHFAALLMADKNLHSHPITRYEIRSRRLAASLRRRSAEFMAPQRMARLQCFSPLLCQAKICLVLLLSLAELNRIEPDNFVGCPYSICRCCRSCGATAF